MKKVLWISLLLLSIASWVVAKDTNPKLERVYIIELDLEAMTAY